MFLKLEPYKNKFFVFFLILFSITINYYYGNRGVFPIDSFLHFDTGYRILNGEYPFINFWTVSGSIIKQVGCHDSPVQWKVMSSLGKNQDQVMSPLGTAPAC